MQPTTVPENRLFFLFYSLQLHLLQDKQKPDTSLVWQGWLKGFDKLAKLIQQRGKATGVYHKILSLGALHKYG